MDAARTAEGQPCRPCAHWTSNVVRGASSDVRVRLLVRTARACGRAGAENRSRVGARGPHTSFLPAVDIIPALTLRTRSCIISSVCCVLTPILRRARRRSSGAPAGSTLAPREPKTQVLAYRALSPFAVLTFGFEGTSQRAGPTASVRACEEQVQDARDACGAGYALRCVRHHQAMTRRGNGGQVGSTMFLRAQKMRDYVHG